MVLHTSDLAEAFKVNRCTISAWVESGILPPGGRMGPRGHRRWSAASIAPILVAQGLPVPASWGVPAVAA